MTTGTKWVIGCAVLGSAALVLIVLGVMAFFLLAGRGRRTAIETQRSGVSRAQPGEWTQPTPERVREATATPASDRIVLIVSDDSAYTVFLRISAARLEEIKAKSPGLTSAEQVSWESFKQGRDRYVRSHIVKNEYPQHRVADGLAALLEQNEGTPIGLTWNGGIAITNNDYQHAKRTRRQYEDDPAEYERSRVDDPRGDPVHPRGHFESLLGDPYLSTTAE
jgi:hypothetical protein